jgi:hypothetical protein
MIRYTAALTRAVIVMSFVGIGHISVSAAFAQANDKTANKPVSKSEPSGEGATGPQVTAIDIKPGDRWVYAVRDDITGDLKFTTTLVVTEIEKKTISTQLTTTAVGQAAPSGQALYLFDTEWNLLDDGIWKRTKGNPASGIRLPLQVGKSWSSSIRADRKNPNITFAETYQSKVTAMEPVKLPSGESHETYRIQTAATSAQVLSDGSAGPLNTQTIIQWFSPSINRYVKRTIENRREGKLLSKFVETLEAYTRRRED